MFAASWRRSGTIEVGKLHVEQVVTWQSDLLKTLAPKTVGHHRQTLAQVMDQAVELGLSRGEPGATREGPAGTAHDRSRADR